MQNHKDILLTYDSDSIMNILQRYSPPQDASADVNGCTWDEIQKISKVLNLRLPIKSILYFRMGTNFEGYIHKDINLNNPTFLVNYALNLPLVNCNHVYMKWFTQNDLAVNAEPFGGPSEGTPTPLLHRSNATCIDTVNCNSTKLVSVNDWHAIENHSTENLAYLISIRFSSSVKPSMDLPINEWLLKVGSNH